MNTKTILRWLFALGVVALVDDIYISISHFIPGPAPEFAYWLGVPSAPLGILVYLVVLALIAIFMKTGSTWSFYVLLGVLTSQFISGITAFYLQTFELGFFCPYAYLFVAVSFAMFALIVKVWLSRRSQTGVLAQQR